MGEIKNIFFKLFIVLWGIFAPLSVWAEFGQTPWYDLPFAKVRILSCLDGFQSQKMMVGGLQIDLKSGWTLQKPQLKSLNEKDLMWIDYPIRPNTQETTTYSTSLLIPVIGTPLLNQEFTLGVQGDLTACHEKTGCLTLPIQIHVPLNKNTHNYTNYCAFIMEGIKQVPLPSGDRFKATFKILSENEIQLTFAGMPKISQAFLQNDTGYSFKVLERNFDKNKITFLLRGKNLSEVKNWILITNQGVFRVPVSFDIKGTNPTEKNISWWRFLTSGFLLFLCTPFFIFWGLAWPKTKTTLVQQSTQIVQWGTLVFIVFGILLVLSPKLLLGLNDSIYLWVSLILMGISLVFPPKKISLVCALFFFWPKPYLWSTIKSLYGQNALFCVWILGIILWLWLFFFWRIKGQKIWEKLIHQSLKKTPFATNFIFLFPTLCLLGWSLYQINLPKVPFEITTEVSEGVSVVCENSECLPWENEKYKTVHFISENSLFGQALLQKYHRTYGPMVIFNDHQEITVFPEGMSPRKFHTFNLDWQNYHVLSTLTNPPIRSGDAPHAP